MEKIINFLIIGIIAAMYLGERFLGWKCPICGSRRHWSTHYWGMNKDYEDLFCSKCYQALYNPETGEFTTFKQRQNFL
ncbi:MAG: hypothetical protein K0R34_1690 [Herbinix sp.]|nr:hypothetical protein [Herbinix sp.]